MERKAEEETSEVVSWLWY